MMRGIASFSVVVGAVLLSACSSQGGNDGPSQEDMRDALTRNGAKVQSTERIACKAAPDKPGFICDFRAVVCGKFDAKCDKSLIRTARFVNVGGSWMFMGDVVSPSRGYEATPQADAEASPSPTDATPSPVVTDLTPTPAPSVTPVPTASPSATPRPAPTASPTPAASPKPDASPTPRPSPKPTATPSPKPSPKPSKPAARAIPPGVNGAWLAGRWGRDAAACDAKHAVQFAPRGTFYGKRGAARWTLKNGTATVSGIDSDTAKPYSQSLPIARTGTDTMTIEGRRYRRCAD